MKTKRKQAKEPETALETASNMLETGLAGLRAYVADVSEVVAESKDVEAAAEFAHLLVRISQINAELRKSDAEERRRGEHMTPDAVLAYFKGLPKTEQAGLLAELERAGAVRGSGLA